MVKEKNPNLKIIVTPRNHRAPVSVSLKMTTNYCHSQILL